MTTTITLTQQWQLYLPQSVRDALELTQPVRFRAEVKNKQLVLTPTPNPVLKLAGSISRSPKQQSIDLDNIRDQIETTRWAKNYSLIPISG